ncbi:MAG: membrane protein insertion efficiency factor YidD [Planctomycetes bacterium]|nr:membrane protein insertion efficiency factor YidD [Planctomycetota bacterium]
MRGAFQLFQRHFSPYDGSRCPFCPTCSEYGRLAVERHGFLRGSVLAAGRLQRCNPGAAGAYPRLIVGGNDFYPLHDPVPE